MMERLPLALLRPSTLTLSARFLSLDYSKGLVRVACSPSKCVCRYFSPVSALLVGFPIFPFLLVSPHLVPVPRFRFRRTVLRVFLAVVFTLQGRAQSLGLLPYARILLLHRLHNLFAPQEILEHCCLPDSTPLYTCRECAQVS